MEPKSSAIIAATGEKSGLAEFRRAPIGRQRLPKRTLVVVAHAPNASDRRFRLRPVGQVERIEAATVHVFAKIGNDLAEGAKFAVVAIATPQQLAEGQAAAIGKYGKAHRHHGGFDYPGRYLLHLGIAVEPNTGTVGGF